MITLKTCVHLVTLIQTMNKEMAVICKWFLCSFYTVELAVIYIISFRLYKSQQPLLNLEFAVIDGIRENRKKIEKTINDMGGSVTTRIHCNLAAVISNHQNIQKDSFPLKRAKECNVHVVSEEFLLDAAQTSDPIQSLIIQRSLCDWESDVSEPNPNIIF